MNTVSRTSPVSPEHPYSPCTLHQHWHELGVLSATTSTARRETHSTNGTGSTSEQTATRIQSALLLTARPSKSRPQSHLRASRRSTLAPAHERAGPVRALPHKAGGTHLLKVGQSKTGRTACSALRVVAGARPASAHHLRSISRISASE